MAPTTVTILIIFIACVFVLVIIGTTLRMSQIFGNSHKTRKASFGVSIVTYGREKHPGKSQKYLNRTLKCLKSQSDTDFVVFLVGDAYEPRKVFDNTVKKFRKELGEARVVAHNMKTAGERGTAKASWYTLGTKARGISYKMGHKYGVKYMANYDDDDIWFTNHIDALRQGFLAFPKALVVGTHALKHRRWHCFPPLPKNGGSEITSGHMFAETVCHSATALRLFDKNLIHNECDLFLWQRLYKEHGKEAFVRVPVITMSHPTEKGHEFRKPRSPCLAVLGTQPSCFPKGLFSALNNSGNQHPVDLVATDVSKLTLLKREQWEDGINLVVSQKNAHSWQHLLPKKISVRKHENLPWRFKHLGLLPNQWVAFRVEPSNKA